MTNPPCPTWCTTGHAHENYDRDQVLVHHQRIAQAPTWTVDLTAVTVPDHNDQPTLVDPRIVFDWHGAGDGVLTRSDATAIAEALLEAAHETYDSVWQLPDEAAVLAS